MCQKRLNSKLYSADRLMSIDNGLNTAIWSGTAARSIGSAARRLQSWRIAYTKKVSWTETNNNWMAAQTNFRTWQRC